MSCTVLQPKYNVGSHNWPRVATKGASARGLWNSELTSDSIFSRFYFRGNLKLVKLVPRSPREYDFFVVEYEVSVFRVPWSMWVMRSFLQVTVYLKEAFYLPLSVL